MRARFGFRHAGWVAAQRQRRLPPGGRRFARSVGVHGVSASGQCIVAYSFLFRGALPREAVSVALAAFLLCNCGSGALRVNDSPPGR